ncbi:MAG TPA: hypothetical protein VN933_09645 [Candidatus Eremiobacteraceae bacterium]|jgi:hypothetical protein|nr:hypothetical protein [Candidatus Eremiobacteraceae bacterium]
MDRDRHNRDATEATKANASKPKRPYVKPAFQHEKVFETMALACGKLGPTQAQCRFNRRNS